ncbi:methyltransferase domain-containing protein [Zeaxanthinibacter enoshimensis]|uniref:Trans-aconitate methyltransferase n=1 Tax=Zeaxanthinibacter enoshimensis TaxID=392009 RepID=A0A4R6TQ37_9FLAO|nr:methyltransferase domain-containing protein [Zeaxanthinibacter enoshimensis]TDQ32213.1 trans-aconitate methyltransferase [Zeaxanthinibacter enoshimensis]
MSAPTTKWEPGFYNEKHSFVYRYGEDLLQLLAPNPQQRILDLGCGSGQLTYRISKMAGETVGMDSSAEMIADARIKFPKLEFHVGDAADFSFQKKFDVIFSNATLHWVKDHCGAISCMYGNLNPGGKIVLEFGGKGNVQTIIHALRSVLRKRGYEQQSGLELWYFPSVGEYSTKLESAGFRVIFAEHFDRSTELADPDSGIKDWLSMFTGPFFTGIPGDHKEEILNEVQQKCREQCWHNGKWYADYKRIRVIAIKE